VARDEWSAALSAYQSGDKSTAYQQLGHVAHLVTGDMFQPAHTHDDPHAPHFVGGDGESIESRYDEDPGVVSSNGRPVLSPVSGALTQSGVSIFGDTSARLTYIASMFPGTLHVAGGEVTGDVVGSVPFGNQTLIIRFVERDLLALDADFFQDHLIIGNINPLVYDPSVPGDIGLNVSGLFRHQDWWQVPTDESPSVQNF
jgi:hypothetical protein